MLSKGEIELAKQLIGPSARMVEPLGALVKGVARPMTDGVQWGLNILWEMKQIGTRVIEPGFCVWNK